MIERAPMPIRTFSSTALVRKLANVIELSPSDCSVLELLGWNSRRVLRHRDIVGEGEPPLAIQLILEGWACRYKILPGGKRQITAVLLPGDLCDLHVTLLGRMDHGIAALSNVKVAAVSRAQLDRALAARPNLALGMDWMTMVDLATLRAWMASLGQTSALARTAHLLCELHQRTANIGLGDGASFPFWMTQIDMADATGQTPVNMNRAVGHLRRSGLVGFEPHAVTIPDVPALRRIGEFDPAYLHAEPVTHR